MTTHPSGTTWHDGRPLRGADASDRDRRRTARLRVWRPPWLGDAEVIAGTAIHVCVPRHAHAEYQLAAVADGALRLEARGAAHVGAPGDLLACAPDEPHAARSARAAGWSGVLVHLPPERVARAAADAADAAGRPAGRRPRPLPAPAPLARRPVLAEALGALARALGALDGGGLRLAAEARFEAVLAALAGAGTADGAAPPPPAPDAVRRARAYLDAHATGPDAALSLARLAAEVGLSRWHLVRAFTRAVGLPPHAYVMQRRVALAKRRLAAGVPLGEVALDAGFAHQSHFTRHFSRLVDMSPGRYAALCGAAARRARPR